MRLTYWPIASRRTRAAVTCVRSNWRALVKLKALKGWTSTTLAKELALRGRGYARRSPADKLPEEVQAMVDDRRVAESTAYEISKPARRSKQDRSRARCCRERSSTAMAWSSWCGSRVAIRKSTPKASRLAMRTEGVAVNVTAGVPLTWDSCSPRSNASARKQRSCTKEENPLPTWPKRSKDEVREKAGVDRACCCPDLWPALDACLFLSGNRQRGCRGCHGGFSCGESPRMADQRREITWRLFTASC